jgi:hypothetical protein
MKNYRELLEARPTGGRQHTPGALKSFGKRLDRETKARRAITHDPNSDFNRHIDAIQNNQPIWTQIDGIGVYRVPGSRIAALPTNDKKSSRTWVVFNVDSRKEMTQVRKNELFGYLARYAVDQEGMR